MEPRNKELFNQAENLADVFVQFMESHSFIESYGTLFDRVETLVKADANLIAKILELRQDWKEEGLSKILAQTQRFLRTLMKSDVYKTAPHPATEEGYKDEIAWFLTRVLEVRANQTNFLSDEGLERQYRETFFPRLYKVYEDYLYNPSPKDYLSFPIGNLTSSKSIDLETWQIRQMSENEIDSLVEAHHKLSIPLEMYPEFIVCLVCNDNWQDNIRTIITTLRLLKPEKIFLKYGYRAFSFPFCSWQIFNVPEGTSTTEQVPFVASDIAQEEVELKTLWTALSNIKETNYLTTALRRFNFAYEREKVEDAWVDYFISLESLFLKSGENSELMHRLSNRISKVLVEADFLKRKEMKKKIGDWYNIRSRIVHGATVRPNELNQIDDLNQKVSASIRWFVSSIDRDDHDAILDMLDLM